MRAHVRLGDAVRERNLVRDAAVQSFAARVQDFFAAVDVYLSPVSAIPPITVGVHPQVGTPLSVQLAAAGGAERTVLGLAALIERLASRHD